MKYLLNSFENVDLELFYISSNFHLEVQKIVLIVSEMEKAHSKCISKPFISMAIFGNFRLSGPVSYYPTWLLASYMLIKPFLVSNNLYSFWQITSFILKAMSIFEVHFIYVIDLVTIFICDIAFYRKINTSARRG